MDKTCGTCKHWRQTGHEDSGIAHRVEPGNWFYAVGTCENPVAHLGTYSGRKETNIPFWAGFYCHKAKRGG